MTFKNTNIGWPAFPAQFFDERATGMTLRDYFAAKAMQGLLPNYGWNDETLAKMSYEVADAMLEARND